MQRWPARPSGGSRGARNWTCKLPTPSIGSNHGADLAAARRFPTILDGGSGHRARVSKNSEAGKAIDYSLKRWTELTRYLDDGRLCMTNNAAERELRCRRGRPEELDLRRFRRGRRRAAALYTLIATAKLNEIDPQAWLADMLTRLPDYPSRRIGELLPWQWCGLGQLAA